MIAGYLYTYRPRLDARDSSWGCGGATRSDERGFASAAAWLRRRRDRQRRHGHEAFIESEMGRWLARAGRSCRAARGSTQGAEICVENAQPVDFQRDPAPNPSNTGMGTTLVVGCFPGRAPDAGPYRRFALLPPARAGTPAITRDHSLLQEQIDAGLITPEQALTSLNKNLVTRALGVEDTVLVEVNEHRVESGDLYLMCSERLVGHGGGPGYCRHPGGRGNAGTKVKAADCGGERGRRTR